MYPIVLDDEFLYSYVSVPSVRLSCMDVDLKSVRFVEVFGWTKCKKKKLQMLLWKLLGNWNCYLYL